MIYFNEIFEKAFSIFDDPDISRKYYLDKAGFQRDMLDYLLIGKGKPALPEAIASELILCDQSQAINIEIDGENTATYVLEGDQLPLNSGITYRIGNEFVRG